LPATYDLRAHLAPNWTVLDEKTGWIKPPNGRRMRVKLLILKSNRELPKPEAPMEFGFGFEVRDDGADADFPETQANSHRRNRYTYEFSVGERKSFIIASR
jgi:hypothetical protein